MIQIYVDRMLEQCLDHRKYEHGDTRYRFLMTSIHTVLVITQMIPPTPYDIHLGLRKLRAG